MGITITEALADVKTTGKRIEKKREFVVNYLARPEGVKDPLEKDGGSDVVVSRELQAIADLEERIVKLRIAIFNANSTNSFSIEAAGVTSGPHTVMEWLTWRREVAPKQKEFLDKMRQQFAGLRATGKQQGWNVLAPGAQAERPQDVVVSVSEADIGKEIEKIEEVLGTLDGRLSLFNATVMIADI